MMSTIPVIILVASVAQVYAKDALGIRALKDSPMHYADVDSTMLAKPGRSGLAVRNRGVLKYGLVIPGPGLHSGQRPMIGQRRRVDMKMNAAPISVPWEECYIPSLCQGLDGEPLSHEMLGQALGALDSHGADALTPTVTHVAVQQGSEKRNITPFFFGQFTGVLQVSTSDGVTRPLFVKKASAVEMCGQPWTDRLQTLMTVRTELRFFQEFAPKLASRGVLLPRVALLVDQLEAIGDIEVKAVTPAFKEPSAEVLRHCGAMLFLEPVMGFEQSSPQKADRAQVALTAAARLHAAAWEDKEFLSAAAARLQRHGGNFALSIRNPKELQKIKPHWGNFVEKFTPIAPELFALPDIIALGERLERWSGWVAEQLSPGPEDRHATLIHGDFQFMNVFLPLHEQQQAMMIDFASTGVGFGMTDVAMLLHHGVIPDELADGGEERLIDGYLAALAEAGGPEAAAYPRELAMRHYQLAVIDYGRFIISHFWENASLETFSARANFKNVALVNRNVDAALAFVVRISKCLQQFEAEENWMRDGPQTDFRRMRDGHPSDVERVHLINS